jgi:hypothetical protein
MQKNMDVLIVPAKPTDMIQDEDPMFPGTGMLVSVPLSHRAGITYGPTSSTSATDYGNIFSPNSACVIIFYYSSGSDGYDICVHQEFDDPLKPSKDEIDRANNDKDYEVPMKGGHILAHELYHAKLIGNNYPDYAPPPPSELASVIDQTELRALSNDLQMMVVRVQESNAIDHENVLRSRLGGDFGTLPRRKYRFIPQVTQPDGTVTPGMLDNPNIDVHGRWTGDGGGPCRAPGGGCLLATAAAAHDDRISLNELRDLRDRILREGKIGSDFFWNFWRDYYKFSPEIVRRMQKDSEFRGEMVSLVRFFVQVATTVAQIGLGYGGHASSRDLALSWDSTGIPERNRIIRSLRYLDRTWQPGPFARWGLVELLEQSLLSLTAGETDQVAFSCMIQSWLSRIPMPSTHGHRETRYPRRLRI